MIKSFKVKLYLKFSQLGLKTRILCPFLIKDPSSQEVMQFVVPNYNFLQDRLSDRLRQLFRFRYFLYQSLFLSDSQIPQFSYDFIYLLCK